MKTPACVCRSDCMTRKPFGPLTVPDGIFRWQPFISTLRTIFLQSGPKGVFNFCFCDEVLLNVQVVYLLNWTCNRKQGEESFYLWSLKARIDPKQTKQLVVRCPNKQQVLYWASPPICCYLPALSCYLPLPCPSLQPQPSHAMLGLAFVKDR